MNWTIIRTEKEYKNALERLDAIFHPTNTKEQDEYELLVMLINNYEGSNFHVEESDPIQVIKLKMKYMGLRQKDMIKYFGSKSTSSKILSYKSPLTLKYVWILSKVLDLPVELLAKPYKIDNWKFMKKFENVELKEMTS